MHEEPAWLDAVTLSGLIRAKQLSPVEVLESVIGRIDRRNGELNAFCTLALDDARRAAHAVERRVLQGDVVGPLAGVPISIKDLILTRSLRTTGGTLAYRDLVPDQDDIVVRRLIDADAIILGKTNVSELGYSLTGDNPLFGVTRNPWNLRHTSGGSSAGAAAAVATGMGPIAIGSDGGGSIRLPAAYCGVFGFKPSMGRVPLYPGCRDERYPGLSSWETLEHIGPLTRTVADAALALSVIAGPDRRDRHSIPSEITDWAEATRRAVRGLRIGYCQSWGGVTVDADIMSRTEAAARVFESELGCQVEVVQPGWDNPLRHFRTLMAIDSDLRGMRELAAKHHDTMSLNLSQFLANEWTAELMTDAVKARKAYCNMIWPLFERFDFLLTPISANPPPLADKRPGAADFDRPLPVFTCLANMTGQPAAALPVGFTKDGLPVGVQILGDHLADLQVLALAAAFERVRPWQQNWPPQ